MRCLSVTIPGGELVIPFAELDFQFVRSSGPGGQNVNKVNSKVQLRWNVARNRSLPEDVRARLATRYAGRLTQLGELLISGQRYRDQGKNIADCLERLRELIRAVAVPPKPRAPGRPTRASKRRRLETKLLRSRLKESRRNPPRNEP